MGQGVGGEAAAPGCAGAPGAPASGLEGAARASRHKNGTTQRAVGVGTGGPWGLGNVASGAWRVVRRRSAQAECVEQASAQAEVSPDLATGRGGRRPHTLR
jgi:hypothetical protein